MSSLDWNYVLNLLSELAYLLAVSGVFLMIVMIKGRQALINIIVGLYLGLFIAVQFPYYEQLLGGLDDASAVATVKLIMFAGFVAAATFIVARVMPEEFREKRLESLPKKLLLVLVATVLVMVFSFHVLPVTELLTPGTPIQSLFAPEEYFFWWLILPLGALYLVV